MTTQEYIKTLLEEGKNYVEIKELLGSTTLCVLKYIKAIERGVVFKPVSSIDLWKCRACNETKPKENFENWLYGDPYQLCCSCGEALEKKEKEVFKPEEKGSWYEESCFCGRQMGGYFKEKPRLYCGCGDRGLNEDNIGRRV